MVWQQWVYLIYAIINVAVMIGMIGKERKPYTPGVVAISVILYSFVVWLVLSI